MSYDCGGREGGCQIWRGRLSLLWAHPLFGGRKRDGQGRNCPGFAAVSVGHGGACATRTPPSATPDPHPLPHPLRRSPATAGSSPPPKASLPPCIETSISRRTSSSPSPSPPSSTGGATPSASAMLLHPARSRSIPFRAASCAAAASSVISPLESRARELDRCRARSSALAEERQRAVEAR